MLSKFIALIFTLGVMVALQIAVMIYGWGLHPRSWFWIVGMGWCGTIFVSLIADKLKKEK